jgi:hypothetical protein
MPPMRMKSLAAIHVMAAAPLNAQSFAHDFTFRSVVALSRFKGNQLAELRLYPVEEGYGDRLPKNGIPRLVADPGVSAAIFKEIDDATRQFGLPRLEWHMADGVGVVRTAVTAR